jgi:hypothetical protein
VPVAGAALYGHRNLPEVQSLALFVICCFMIISMYGGGFATVPAYLRHMFGTMQVGAIHGRLLTAWSAAGILGPFLVNGIRQHEISVGIPKSGGIHGDHVRHGRIATHRVHLQPDAPARRPAALLPGDNDGIPGG